METIKRLQELREEAADLSEGHGEVMLEVIKLEGELDKAQKAKRDKVLDRFKSGQPVRAASLESKIETLSRELYEWKSIIEAIDSKLTEIRPELEELEQVQKEAEGWRKFALPYVASQVLSGRLRREIREAYKNAPERQIRLSSGEYRTEKNVSACLGGSLQIYIGQLQAEAVRAAHDMAPARYPKPENLDLCEQQGLPFPERTVDRIWLLFCEKKAEFQEKYDVNIGPTEDEIGAKLEPFLPKP